ncbi:hypothetical protein GCM10023090_26680 [Acidovorax lacteus]|uniref:Toxin CptA n=1 Tax=Acidovorax lacteus TaxID=1924988 RepID=A0ABP8LFX7_9BURK
MAGVRACAGAVAGAMIPPVLYAPPAVRFPVGRGSLFLAFLCVPAALSALLSAAWCWWGARQWPWTAAGLALAAWLCAAATAARAWHRHPRGWLGWDGAEWRFYPAVGASEAAVDGWPLQRPPECVWDGQSFMWAALWMGSGFRVWCLLDCRADPQRWMDLRRALYFRPKLGMPADATAVARGPGALPP